MSHERIHHLAIITGTGEVAIPIEPAAERHMQPSLVLIGEAADGSGHYVVSSYLVRIGRGGGLRLEPVDRDEFNADVIVEESTGSRRTGGLEP